tara:strand:+ start:1342 stop:1497 length:156 start_codon:yes stop_codon:yes gene_type:complete
LEGEAPQQTKTHKKRKQKMTKLKALGELAVFFVVSSAILIGTLAFFLSAIN